MSGKVVVSLSGGMDSSTLLAEVRRDRPASEVLAVGFYYGSKHNPYENQAAAKIASIFGVEFRLIDLSGVMLGFKSNLMSSGGTIPEGHYEEASMSQTVVPGRNIIFASVLAGLAWSEGAGAVYMAVHAGDHFIYPDCRSAFVQSMDEAIFLGTDRKVHLETPYLDEKKVDILRRGIACAVPYYHTRTCYKAQPIACGKCGSCQERLEAFSLVGAPDPLDYESRELLPKSE